MEGEEGKEGGGGREGGRGRKGRREGSQAFVER